jgi:hypothetical protein
MDTQIPERPIRSLWSTGRIGPPARRPRPARRVSAWERAVADFAVAWQLSPEERARFRATVAAAAARTDTLVRGLLAEAARLAHETGWDDVSGWCFATCERVTRDASARPTWDEIAIDRHVLERLTPAGADGVSREALLWWCVWLVPRCTGETPEAGRRRTCACALYLGVEAVQAFTAEDRAARERAGLLAAFGAVIARRSRTSPG